MKFKTIETEINLLDMFIVIVVICVAFFFQFTDHELPCPLCLLQRIGFLAIAFGLLLNILYGSRPLYYGLSILASIYTAVVSGRQVLLHIVPGDGGYGTAIFGLHLYTWGFVASIGFILMFIFLLICRKSSAVSRINRYKIKPQHNKYIKWLSWILFLGLIIACLTNAVTVFFECGISQCPDNPTMYKY